jgi:hypothetical protein
MGRKSTITKAAALFVALLLPLSTLSGCSVFGWNPFPGSSSPSEPEEGFIRVGSPETGYLTIPSHFEPSSITTNPYQDLLLNKVSYGSDFTIENAMLYGGSRLTYPGMVGYWEEIKTDVENLGELKVEETTIDVGGKSVEVTVFTYHVGTPDPLTWRDYAINYEGVAYLVSLGSRDPNSDIFDQINTWSLAK